MVDGLDMTHLSTYSSSDSSVAIVDGSRVYGRSAGVAVISAFNNAASVSITVQDAVQHPELVARVVTAMNAASRTQIFDSEDDVGWMYVDARYDNGDEHALHSSVTRNIHRKTTAL